VKAVFAAAPFLRDSREDKRRRREAKGEVRWSKVVTVPFCGFGYEAGGTFPLWIVPCEFTGAFVGRIWDCGDW
jgi:hypothetical protein